MFSNIHSQWAIRRKATRALCVPDLSLIHFETLSSLLQYQIWRVHIVYVEEFEVIISYFAGDYHKTMPFEKYIIMYKKKKKKINQKPVRSRP